MNPREWFVLGIRLFGVWMLIQGVTYVAAFADQRLGMSEQPRGMNPNGNILYAAFDFALAAYFLFGARHLARVCDAEDKARPDRVRDD